MLKTKHTNIYDMFKEIKENGFDNMSIREKIDISLGYPRVSLLLLAMDIENTEKVDNEFSRIEYLEAYAERTSSDADIENTFFGLDPALLDDLESNISEETKNNMKEFYKDMFNITIELTNQIKDNTKLCAMIGFGVIMMDPALPDALDYGLDIADIISKSEVPIIKEALHAVVDYKTLDTEIWNKMINILK